MKLTIKDDNNKTILSVTSDGEARFKVRGTQLRDNVGRYETEDDMHIIGLVTWLWGAHMSREYLRRRLNEHDKETS
jgi:hypothetical protein